MPERAPTPISDDASVLRIAREWLDRRCTVNGIGEATIVHPTTTRVRRRHSN